jgi:uncharacterized repeat protein (TIGR01451 family)
MRQPFDVNLLSMRLILRSLFVKPARWLGLVVSAFLATTAIGDLRSPSWYDQNAVSSAPDWHYRVPISIPSGTPVNSTIKVDVDFAALLGQLGVSGTFDSNSPRVVRSTGALSTLQQFTDTVYANATDAAGNSRGEVRFILEDAGAVTYYLYFDITANGSKLANPQTPINGNFEFGGSGTATPPGWTLPTALAGYDAQIRPSENPSVTTDGTTLGNGTPPITTDGTPLTGAYSYMLGARSANEPNNASNNPAVVLRKTIVVPSGTPGNLTLRYRPEGWDSDTNGSNNFDFIRVWLAGAATTELVGPIAGTYTTYPFSPNYGVNAATATRSGYGQYNGWDTDTNGTHRPVAPNSAMALSRGSQPWFTVTVSLAAYAGQTITLNISSSSIFVYRTWFHIDDVEWSVVAVTLGTPEGFGVNITAPTVATTYTGGQKLIVRAQLDAGATAASNPVTANLYDNSGTLLVSSIVLYNDGTHGDATANDAIWSNDGSVVASPTYTFPAGLASGSSWKVRVFAKDASGSSVGASNGLIHIPAQASTPETQTTFYNIDEQTFTVNVPALQITKSSAVLSDPVNGATNPKRIPGGIVRYAVTVTNTGPATVDASSLAITDPVPASTTLCVSTLCSNPIVEFIDGSPTSGLSYSYASNVTYSNTVGGGAPFTYVPVADANGFDAAVTGIRVAPTGTMAAASGGNPSFTIRVRVKVN